MIEPAGWGVMEGSLIGMGRRFLLGCVFVTVGFGKPTFPADTASPAHVPIQTELVGKLDAAHAKTGDAVYAKVRVKWQDNTVTLQAGVILRGCIVRVQARSKTNRNSSLALRFDSVEFNKNDTRPMSLMLAAVMASDDSSADASEYQPLTSAVGLSLGSGSTGAGGPGAATSASGTRSLSAAATKVYLQARLERQPKTIQAGQVVGVRGVKISVGGRPEGSSVLYASHRDVRLASGSLLAFVAGPTGAEASGSAPTIPATSASAISSPLRAAARAPNDAFSDEADLCSPPECRDAVSMDESPASLRAATVPVKDLGYVAPVNRAMLSFNYSSAITYLSADELLFTFNRHVLVPRGKGDAGFPDLHMVRAVLIDLKTKMVEHAIDSRVCDANQYLWPVGSDHVLAHVGHELRLYGPHLKLLRGLRVEGPVRFVAMSPSQTYFAVGTLRERHSDTVHRQLEAAEGREPEEDLEVQILDHQFNVLAIVLQSSCTAFPVLSDEGKFDAVSEGHGRWRIEEDLWDGAKRVLTHASSACRPQMTSLPHDLLFVVGCDCQASGRWYRVLRHDGKTRIKGWSASSEIEHLVLNSAGGDRFAVSMVKARKAIAYAAIFQVEDLDSQMIDVYRVDNGKRVSALRIAAPVPTRQSLALSPSGDQLAVLDRDEISFYTVPGT